MTGPFTPVALQGQLMKKTGFLNPIVEVLLGTLGGFIFVQILKNLRNRCPNCTRINKLKYKNCKYCMTQLTNASSWFTSQRFARVQGIAVITLFAAVFAVIISVLIKSHYGIYVDGIWAHLRLFLVLHLIQNLLLTPMWLLYRADQTKCPKCGTMLNENKKYECPNCGKLDFGRKNKKAA